MPQDRWLAAIKRLLNAESYFLARQEAEAESQEEPGSPTTERHPEPGPQQ